MVKVLNSHPVWRPATQTRMYNQIRFLPTGIESSHFGRQDDGCRMAMSTGTALPASQTFYCSPQPLVRENDFAYTPSVQFFASQLQRLSVTTAWADILVRVHFAR